MAQSGLLYAKLGIVFLTENQTHHVHIQRLYHDYDNYDAEPHRRVWVFPLTMKPAKGTSRVNESVQDTLSAFLLDYWLA